MKQRKKHRRPDTHLCICQHHQNEHWCDFAHCEITECDCDKFSSEAEWWDC